MPRARRSPHEPLIVAVLVGVVAAMIAATAIGCAPAEGRVLREAGVRLVDANARGVAYVDRTSTLWFIALDEDGHARGEPQKIAADVDDAVMPAKDAGVVVAFVGLDAATGIAAHAVLRDARGDVHALGDDVNAEQVKASPDGKHVYHEELRGTAEAGNEALFLDGEALMTSPRLAHKEKARFTVDGVLVLGVDIVDPELEENTRAVITYEDAHTPHPIARNTANATAVTHDGAFVIYGANEDGPLVDLEMQPIFGGPVTRLSCTSSASSCTPVSDARIKVTPDDSEVFVLDGAGALVSIALAGDHARTRSGAAGAVDIIAVSDDLVVTTSGADDVTGAMHLEVAAHPALPGAPEALEGAAAADVDDGVDVGMSADGTRYFFVGGAAPVDDRDPVKLVGTLGVFGAPGADDIARDVRKARPLEGGGVAWLDAGDRLWVRTIDDDGALGGARLVQINVDRFRTAGERLAYSVRAEENAGLWLVEP